ncbi:MAG: hypothetical protein M1834_006764 [Cirrosporium novae-zelandiae]|nr:MAG: hypothetical protein M1834_006764 [Cirrosporium novae-zelandiae]
MSNLTPRDQEFIIAIFKCSEGSLKIDYDQVAKELNLKNAASARVSWSGVRKKLHSNVGGDDSNANGTDTAPSAPVTKKKPATPRKRKAAALKTDNDNGDENGKGDENPASPALTTPSKPKPKRARKSKAATKKEEQETSLPPQPPASTHTQAQTNDGEAATTENAILPDTENANGDSVKAEDEDVDMARIQKEHVGYDEVGIDDA